MGKMCVEVTKSDKIANISETLCIGCNICTKKCPFEAISIINLPANLESETTHRYGGNSFKLHRLPTPRPGQVLGLVGTNGIGKSTALQILAGKIKPNLGNYEDVPDWQSILKYFRGNELQNYFTKMIEDRISAGMKVQYVDKLSKSKAADIAIRVLLDKRCAKSEEQKKYFLEEFELNHILDRKLKDLSGGELQRFACCLTCLGESDIYIFDEPSSYLDVRQRLRMAKAIRSLLTADNYWMRFFGQVFFGDKKNKKIFFSNPKKTFPLHVVVVEHDLAVLDYMSDFICMLYGQPGGYGVVTFPAGVREGINQFLDGFVVSENMKFRDTALQFKG